MTQFCVEESVVTIAKIQDARANLSEMAVEGSESPSNAMEQSGLADAMARARAFAESGGMVQ